MRVILFVMQLLILATSCRTEGLAVAKSNPCVIPTSEINLYIENNGKIHFYNGVIFSLDSSDSGQVIQNLLMDSLIFKEFQNQFNLNNNNNDNSAFLILYYQNHLKSFDTVDNRKIQGIGIYYADAKSFIYKLYRSKEGVFEEIKNLTGRTSIIATRQIKDIAQYVFFSNTKQYSILFIDRTPIRAFNGYKVKDELERKVRKYIEQKNRI